MPGDLAGEIKHFEHRGTLADDAVKIEISEQLGIKIAHLSALRDEVCQIVESFVKARSVYGLAEIIAGPAFDGFDGGVHGIVPGHQDDVNTRIYRERFFQEFHSIHAGHVNIGEHHAAVSAMDNFQHLKRVGGTR